MDWEARMITDAALAPYLAGGGPGLRARVGALIAQQQATWPMLREASAALTRVENRRWQVRGSEVVTQFNPARIKSTAARVDAASIRARPCFLCPENLPPEEKGIAFGPECVILCNPYPVLPRHLVITARRHTPQAIEGSFGALLDAAQGLGEEYFALYNGPACGASAPDHLHFQACERASLPIVCEVESWPRRYPWRSAGLELFAMADYRVNVLVARGSERGVIDAWFARALSHLSSVTSPREQEIAQSPQPEPLLNLVVTFDRAGWTVYLFPRQKHRPACYHAEGEARLTVSPAAIDLAGVMVVPEAEHFARLTAPELEQIYVEVTLDDARFAEWKGRLARDSGR